MGTGEESAIAPEPLLPRSVESRRARRLDALGWVFWGFAAFQVAALVMRSDASPITDAYLVLSAAFATAYGIGGWRLRRGPNRGRGLALALSLLALLAFPVGTAVGAFGLWVLFTTRRGGTLDRLGRSRVSVEAR